MKSGYVAIVGRPNVGKSTLLNSLVNCPLAAVSPKPQTTRQRIIGIANGPDYQILFLDTPGLLVPRYPLQKLMAREIDLALADADVILWVVEPVLPEANESLSSRKDVPVVVAINKIDTVSKPELLPVIEAYSRQGYETIVPISALRRDGIDELRTVLISLLPEGAPYYPSDQLTVQPERFFVAELIRETIFHRYGEEIPYSTMVEIEEFREQPGRKDVIRAVIYVERESQKAIVIGRQGEALKRVGIEARKKIEAFLERPVFLELQVKTKQDWRHNEAFIRRQFQT